MRKSKVQGLRLKVQKNKIKRMQCTYPYVKFWEIARNADIGLFGALSKKMLDNGV